MNVTVARSWTILLVRVDTLKKWTDFRCEVVAILRANSVVQPQPTTMDIGAVGKGQSGVNGKGKRWWKTEQSNAACVFETWKHGAHVRKLSPLSDCAENVERSVMIATTQAKGSLQEQGRSPKTCWNCGESGHLSLLCPKKKVHAVDWSAATVSVVGSQETVMVGAIRICFDLGSVSEWSLEPRGENEGICSIGTASACEGDVVDIEINSGAEVSCLPSNIGADTYPLHETKLSMYGCHHVPYLLILRPMCLAFSQLQALLEQGRRHLEFACSLAKSQIEQGGRVLFQHPWTATSLNEP